MGHIGLIASELRRPLIEKPFRSFRGTSLWQQLLQIQIFATPLEKVLFFIWGSFYVWVPLAPLWMFISQNWAYPDRRSAGWQLYRHWWPSFFPLRSQRWQIANAGACAFPNCPCLGWRSSWSSCNTRIHFGVSLSWSWSTRSWSAHSCPSGSQLIRCRFFGIKTAVFWMQVCQSKSCS